MAVEAKIIRLCVFSVTKFLLNACYKCVQKHPFLSGAAFIFFLVYAYFPSIFIIFISFSPVLACVVVYSRTPFSYSHHPSAKNLKENEKKEERTSRSSWSLNRDASVHRIDKPYLRPQMSRRRNKNTELEKLIYQAALDEVNPKKEKADFSMDQIEVSGDPGKVALASQPSKPESDGSKARCEDNSEETEEDDDGNKAVEWTDDDQKNLMDLGISEMERNKRLESLIAKRRARKLLSFQLRGTTVDLSDDSSAQIAPILFARTSIFSSAPGTPTPGSAPSVLLPTRNPFDLPYDPFEEKLNLTGDSFHEEFMPVHQKDAFCRHESFTFGSSMAAERKHVNNMINIRREKEEAEEEGEGCGEVPSFDNTSENHLELGVGEYEHPGSVSLSSSLDEGREVNAASSTDDFANVLRNSLQNSLEGSTVETKMEERMFYTAKGTSHTPTYSIASDMLVEVSEVGSPPLTIGTDIPPDEESVTYDEDTEKENTPSKKYLCGASSYLIGIGVESREIQQVEEIRKPISPASPDASSCISVAMQESSNPYEKHIGQRCIMIDPNRCKDSLQAVQDKDHQTSLWVKHGFSNHDEEKRVNAINIARDTQVFQKSGLLPKIEGAHGESIETDLSNSTKDEADLPKPSKESGNSKAFEGTESIPKKTSPPNKNEA